MKLSAPHTPTSPEPVEPDQPKVESDASTSNVPPQEVAASRPALAWPAWFAGADLLLAALAVVLAFLVGSFVARNTDLWVHLAAGQRLLTGEYRPGSDPFSYSAAERVWVNHSLLYDAGFYLLYRVDPSGAVLIAVKALAVALAFGLLLSLRRPGHSLWPWAVVAVVAVLAAAPRLLLSPLVGSVLLLAATLVLIFRMPHRPNSWRFPIAIGITFWLWAMVDDWFLIGPLTLALVLIGELAQRMLTGPSSSEDGAEPLGAVPDPSTLARALGIGILACMLNPHHVRVWELPFELTGPDSLKADLRFKQLLMSPLDPEYRDSDHLGRMTGYNLNGLAHVVLLLSGMLILGLGAGRLRFAHLALWAGFAVLSLFSIYAIPFFAVVSVPIIASQLNAVSSKLRLKSWGDPTTRFVLVGSASGRVIVLVSAIAVCVLAWPGWVHPMSDYPAFDRRVAWGIYRDGGMVRAAEQLETWRQEGRLPADARGLITTTDLANYCAWFAPSEKVFVNGRYNHHREELPDYLAFRKGFRLIKSDDALDMKQMEEKFLLLGVEYVAVSALGGGSQLPTRRAAVVMWLDFDRWSPWYLNGRSMIAGWRSSPSSAKPSFDSLRLDPLALAFGPRAERLDPGQVKPAPPEMGWEQEFIRGVNISPPGADEAIGWTQYGSIRSMLIEEKRLAVRIAMALADRVGGGGGSVLYFSQVVALLMTDERPESDELAAIPFLALRAAHRAIAADPDHPDGYVALAVALADRSLNISEEERVIARITALRQFLARIPPPARYKRGAYLGTATGVAEELFWLYVGRDQPTFRTWGVAGMTLNLPAVVVLREFSSVLAQTEKGPQVVPTRSAPIQSVIAGPFLLPVDTARDALLLAEKYAPLDFETEEERKAAIEDIRAKLKGVEEQYLKATNFYERRREDARNRGLQMRLREQVEAALANNLVEEALRLLTDRDTDISKEFGRDALKFALVRVALRLVTGRLEEAADDLEILPTRFDEAEAAAPKEFVKAVHQLRDPLRMQIYLKLVLEGNYAEAGTLLEQVQGQIVVRSGNVKTPDQRSEFSWPTGLSTSGFDVAVGMKLWFQDHLYRYENARGSVVATQVRESEFFFRRGLLSLLEGDIAGAKKRFEQCTIPAVKEWNVPERRNMSAERLLRLIRRAEKTERK